MKHHPASRAAFGQPRMAAVPVVRAAGIGDQSVAVEPHQLAATIERSFWIDRTDRHYPPMIRGLILFGMPVMAWGAIAAGLWMR